MPTAYLALYDTFADWESGHLVVELHTGRFTGTPWEVVTVADSADPVLTMGGLRVVPETTLSDVTPTGGDLLVLTGAEHWDAGGGEAWTELARRVLGTGGVVAAICGATVGLARAGLLDERDHTSAAREYLAATGYAGTDRYVDARAVIGGDVVTAGPDSPVQFARAVLQRLELVDDSRLEAYEGVFHRGDPASYAALVAG